MDAVLKQLDLQELKRRTVINTINSLHQAKLIASHDLDMVLDTCQRVILVSHGRVTADGRTEDILRGKALLEANRMELPLCLPAARQRVQYQGNHSIINSLGQGGCRVSLPHMTVWILLTH